MRCPRAGLHHLRSRAASGISLPPPPYPPPQAGEGREGVARGASLDWDRFFGAGNTRCNGARSPPPGWGGRTGSSAPAKSQEAWPEVEPWGRKSLWREPWWNAGRRARPQAEGGASRFFVARTARRLRAGHETLRLPAFRFPFIWSVIVIEAGNHRRPNLTGSCFEGFFANGVGMAWARMRRENDATYPPPRSAAQRGRGTARSAVEGARGGAACICVTDLCSGADAPTGALRAPPPPLSRGRMEKPASRGSKCRNKKKKKRQKRDKKREKKEGAEENGAQKFASRGRCREDADADVTRSNTFRTRPDAGCVRSG